MCLGSHVLRISARTDTVSSSSGADTRLLLLVPPPPQPIPACCPRPRNPRVTERQRQRQTERQRQRQTDRESRAVGGLALNMCAEAEKEKGRQRFSAAPLACPGGRALSETHTWASPVRNTHMVPLFLVICEPACHDGILTGLVLDFFPPERRVKQATIGRIGAGL